MNSRADIKDRRQKIFPKEHKILFWWLANSRVDIKDRRQNIFPKEHKHTSLDSVFDSLRGDNLCF